jgi:hypothetical protein
MPNLFDFSADEDLPTNVGRLKAYLESVDAECARALFDNLAVLDSNDSNARRNFNQKILEALEAAAQVEIDAAGGS